MRFVSRRKRRCASVSSGTAETKLPANLVRNAANQAIEPLEGRVLLSVTNLGASDDAHVRGGTFSIQNYGSATLLEVKENSGNDFHRQSFLKFGLTTLPAGAGVVSAHLQLYGSRNNNDADINVRGHSSADTTWSESTVTYNNRPPIGPTLDSETVSSTTYQWYNWDVSSYVRGQADGSASALTLGLTAELLTSPFARFNSKEAASNHPKLVVTTLLPASGLNDTASTSSSVSLAWIDNSDNESGFKVQRSDDGGTTWTTKTTTAANITSYTDNTVSGNTSYKYQVIATHTADDSGASNVIDVTTPPASPPPPTGTPITLQAAGDAYVRDGTYAGEKYGLLSVLQVKHDGTSYNRDAYIQFDVSGLSGTADSAILRLHGSATIGSGTHSSLLVSAFSLAEPTASWSESTINFTNRPTLQGWNSTTTALDTVDVSTSAGAAWYELDVTNFINAEIAANRSVSTIGLHVVAPVNVTANFDSRETAYDPELVVTPVPPAPAAPGSLSATAASSSQINLAWTDNSMNETGFEIDRSTDPAFAPAQTQTFNLGPNVTAYPATLLAAGTMYYFRARAVNGATESNNSSSASTLTLGTLAISASPTGSSDEGTAVSFNATYASGTPLSGTTYNWTVLRNGQPFATQPSGSAVFTVTSTDEGTYTASVVATTPAGGSDSANSATANVQNVAPTLGISGSGTASAGQTYTLSLTATDPGSADTITWSIDWGDGLTETVSGRNLQPTHEYAISGNYSIVATAGDGTVTGVATTPANISVNVQALPPNTPSNATVALASSIEALLTWTAATGDPADYQIYASIDGGNYELHDITPASNTSYRYFSLTAVSVRFKISAVNDGGESALVDVLAPGGVALSVSGSDPTAPLGVSVTGLAYTDSVPLSWSSVSDATGYVVEWSNGGDEWFIIGDTSASSFTDDYPALGQQQYRIRAYRRTIDSEYSEPTAATLVHPIAPPVAWYDDNAGPNEQGTLSPLHDDSRPRIYVQRRAKRYRLRKQCDHDSR